MKELTRKCKSTRDEPARRDGKVLFRDGKVLFRDGKVLFRDGKVLFRDGKLQSVVMPGSFY